MLRLKVARILLPLTLVLGCQLAYAQQPAETLARVNGDNLTLGDLEQKEGNRLLQARYGYYQAERKALDDLIEQHLLESEARRQGITVEQLLKQEVESKVKDPTEDQLQVYYEGVDAKEPFSTVKEKIREHIRQLRANKLRLAYIEALHSKASIVIQLSPPVAQVSLDNTPILGSRDAPVVLVEFADYQCPYCQKVDPDVEKLHTEFGGKVAVAFKDFPLPMHANAEKAAEAARCAGDQGKFWEYHDLLFREKKLEVADLKAKAEALKLNTDKFDKCLDTGAQAAAVHKDLEEGKTLGLSGTPSFLINGHFFSGAPEYSALREMVEQQLSLSAQTPSPKESSRR
jgi:protein-disulfide isomerase